ncbi:MAG: LTA synthase family protein [Prevotella sp.]|nr:LTA synthase family protein [Prevotella sp.]
MKERVLYLVRFLLLTVLVFIAAKVVFMLCHAADHPFSIGDVFNVVAHGLSLDLSTALYFLSVPFLLTIASLWVRLPGWLLKGYYTLVALAFALAFFADTVLYSFWQFKLDASCLQYLETPTEAMASLRPGYLMIILLSLMVLAGAIYKAYDTIARRPTPYNGSWREAIVYVLAIPLIVIGIRGGIGDATTNIGQVYYSQNQFLNHSAVNPVFSFFYSLTHQLDDLSQYEFYDDETRQQLVDGVYTTESTATDTLLTTDRPSIIVVLMEGAGEEFASVMPHLQQLKQQGVYFSQCYANSWRTDRGTVAVLSGYPTFPTVSVMKMPEKSRLLPSIAQRLKAEGYATHFLYGGDANFTNMRSYILSTGWDRLTSIEDFARGEQRSSQWGVRDDITSKRVTDISSHLQQPFLVGYSTLSSHEPWDVPVKKMDDEVLNSFAYLDDCLYDMVEQLRKTPLWDNLLIVLTADHGINYQQIGSTTPLLKNHIPMLWIGGAVRQPRTVDVLCNQTDLAATLLSQMGIGHADFTFSRDVLSATYTYPLAVNNCNNAQWIVDSTGHVLYDFDSQRIVVSEGSDTDRLLRLSKAILQTTSNDLQKR